MTQNAPPEKPMSKNPMGGGLAIAIFAIVGAIIGGREGQATIGLLAGLVFGIILALVLWYWDSRKG